MSAPKRRNPARLASSGASKVETVVVARSIDTRLQGRAQGSISNATIAPVLSIPGKIEAEVRSFNQACARAWEYARMNAPLLSSISVSDKRRAAFHEAGHVVTALRLGSSFVSAYLWKNDSPNVGHSEWWKQERVWLGRCRHTELEGEDGAVVGIAGAVAEAMAEDKWDDDWSIGMFLEDLSDGDQSSIGDWCIDWIAPKAHELLVADWQMVESIANGLIDGEVLTDGMILEIWEGGQPS